VSPNSLGSCVARSLHTYNIWTLAHKVSEARSSFKVRPTLACLVFLRHVRGAVGNQGVLVASIPDFIMGALPFLVSPILEELVFLACCG
jgi:hypothetical protein